MSIVVWKDHAQDAKAALADRVCLLAFAESARLVGRYPAGRQRIRSGI
jgi:hypothetical protein